MQLHHHQLSKQPLMAALNKMTERNRTRTALNIAAVALIGLALHTCAVEVLVESASRTYSRLFCPP
jgi:hypothetical protein